MHKLFFISILFFTSSCFSADIKKGEKLFQKDCTGCHSTELFSSDRAKITTKDNLKKRVNMCQLNVRAQWFDQDIDDVTEYLSSYYKGLEHTQ